MLQPIGLCCRYCTGGIRCEMASAYIRSKGAGFENKVEQLLRELKEGGIYKNRNPNTPKAQDDNLDVVAWKGFSDTRGSQLIGFAQCNTGTSWRIDLSQLSPTKFM